MARTDKGKASRREFMGAAGKGMVAASVLGGFPAPVKERLRNDDGANAMLSRPQRWPYVIGS